jgi:hypothetical protein
MLGVSKKGVTLFLADESSLADPLAQEFLANARQLHWDILPSAM